MSPERTAYLLLTGMAICFGGTWVAGKVAVDEIGPFTLAAARFGIAAILIYTYARLRGTAVRLPKRGDLPVILAMGLTAIAGYNVLFLTGLTLAPASDGAIIVPGTAPVFTMLLAWLALREQMGIRGILGLAIAMVGLLLVVGPSGAADSDRLIGDLLFLLGAAFWGIYSVISKAVTGRFDAVNVSLYGFVTGTLLLLPATLLDGGLGQIAGASLAALAGLAYLAAFGSVLAFIFLQEAVRRIDVGRASAFALLVPVVGVVSSAVMLGEELGLLTVVGGAIVIIGLWVVQQRPHPPAPQEVPEAIPADLPAPKATT
jgi:drug/metabolite transporter (DMT)-like permease